MPIYRYFPVAPSLRIRLFAAGALVAALLTLTSTVALAAVRFSSIVIDAGSGQVLSAVDADAPRYPASLTKMMTLYLAFQALRDHRISDDALVPISPHAASQVPTKLGLVPGSVITVHQAMLGLVTRSANDAACALGEMIGGSETHFAEMMTSQAHAMGMVHSFFRNASGLPDPDQITTAADMALLARRLIADFPDRYALFSTPAFFWHGQMIANHDNMLKSYPGADGIKTGYTDLAGHNLVTSAVRSNVRLIGVVMGAASNPQRDARMTAMLDDGYSMLNIAPPVVLAAAAPRHHFPSLIGSAEAATLPTGSWSAALRSRHASRADHARFQAVVQAAAATNRLADRTPRSKFATRISRASGHPPLTARCRHHSACRNVRPQRVARR